MHPVDEFYHIREEIRELEGRAKELRQKFIDGDEPLESNAHVVNIKRQKRRVFRRDALPEQILADPSFWQEKTSPIVTVKAREGVEDVALIDDDDVFERFAG